MEKIINKMKAINLTWLTALAAILIILSGCEKSVENLAPAPEETVTSHKLKATNISISNAGFESSWSGWSDSDPSAISGDSNSGSKSAKITGSGGKFTQDISVSANTELTLSAYVKGSWRIGAYVNGLKNSRSGSASDWKQESVTFNSGSATTITIFAEYNAGEGRYDDFSLVGRTGVIDDIKQLSVSSVTATTDDGNIPENTIDGSLSTRWSAKGEGQTITFDLGTTDKVSSLKIAWYKGNTRFSNFEIKVGGSSVYTGSSNGSTLELEEYSFTETEGRYVEIIGHGNSSNTWNSITEVEIYGIQGSNGGDTTPPGEVTNLSATPGNGFVSLSWTNPSDSDFDHVKISYSGGSQISTGSVATISGLTNGTAYTFSVVAYDESNNASGAVTKTATPTDGGGGDYPTQVLGITANNWKINSFVGNPSNNPTYYDDITDANGVSYNTYSDPYYFYTDGEWAFFKCYRGLGGSKTSDNPRVELRELDGNGNEVYWTNEGTNSMTWTVRVDQLSNSSSNTSGVTCVGQIHGPGDSVDDVIRVQFYGEPGQTSGDVRLKIGGYITEKVLGGSVFIDNGYKLDTEYTFKLDYNGDDYVTLYCDGEKIFSEKMDTDKDDNYFKVGNYVQSSKDASYDGSYCLVAVKDLSIVHN